MALLMSRLRRVRFPVLWPGWLTGPIFGKELRVASRRRRNYALRFLYVSLFAAFVVLVWLAVAPATRVGVVQSSRMGQAGITIILAAVWLQFIASQVIAAVTLSTAISDEIYHKTLGLLLTTPINSLQVVLGKLASRLLQILLLLGTSLPLLAIVRVFGGIPWDFLLCAFSITLTTAVFYGSLSLFHSIFSKKAYAAVIETVLVAAVLFVLLPVVVVLRSHDVLPPPWVEFVASCTNPYLIFGEASRALIGPRVVRAAPWPLHCAVSLGASTLLIILSTVFVRKAALRQAAGQGGSWFGRRQSGRSGQRSSARIRRVVGPPVFWRERCMPVFAATWPRKVIAGAVVAGLLLVMYGLCGRGRILGDKDTHSTFVFVFTCIGLLAATVLPATCVTSEKESGAWPILLATPIRSWDILWGKFLGAVQRSAMAWLLLFVHVIIFVVAGSIHPVAILQVAIVVVWVTILLCSTGLYFSVRLQRTTTAVIANLALAGGMWIGVPVLLGLSSMAMRYNGDDVVGLCLDANPVVQACVVTDATAGVNPTLNRYDWQSRIGGIEQADGATRWLLFNVALYGGVGLVFLWRAWLRLRRDPLG